MVMMAWDIESSVELKNSDELKNSVEIKSSGGLWQFSHFYTTNEPSEYDIDKLNNLLVVTDAQEEFRRKTRYNKQLSKNW